MDALGSLTRWRRSSAPADRLIKVHSHPRSGTHFAMAFIGRNFYPGSDLSISSMEWGHWSNRVICESGNPFGQLIGSHKFPRRRDFQGESPLIYVFRDGRAVLLSFFKTENFAMRGDKRASFSEFIRGRIDWHGTPGKRASSKWNLIEHWHAHVQAWHRQQHRPNLLMIRYERLVADPLAVAKQIEAKFFPESAERRGRPMSMEDIDPIRERTGLKPNAARTDAWKEVFTPEDLEYFHRFVPRNSPFLAE